MGLERLKKHCLAISILAIEALPITAEAYFTPHEREKYLLLGPRRQKSFTSARIALKGLARELGLIEDGRSDRDIETLCPDNEKPCLDQSRLFCSVSHSRKFVVAVAHRWSVGVDIEPPSENFLKIEHLLLTPGEQQFAGLSNPDRKQVLTRIWTIKEAAAKALGLPLFQALREINVVNLNDEESRIVLNNRSYPVFHGEKEGQIISLIRCAEY